MAILKVDVVSAEKSLYSGEAKFVVLPGESGELGILPGHTPLITRIRPGLVKVVLEDNSEESFFVAGGLLEVQPGHVTVLSDTAIRGEDLDEEKAELARAKAREALANAKDHADIAVVEAEIEMLVAQASAARRIREMTRKH
ncbi:MAG: F0F1 ATP synthase subunit epsilon [Sheuella sp.]|nr:F0F1 ATP synthase subunit epsilon [Sheuella sp.]